MTEPVAPRTIQPDDLFRLRFLQEARLSPDGRAVVYGVSHVEKDQTNPGQAAAEDVEYMALWLLDVASGAERQLTAGTARDWSPRWSPDGKQVAFLSTRAGKPQVYVIPVDGGEARALTQLKQGVGGAPEWSPDGAWIAFTAGPAEPPDLSKPYRITRHIYRMDGMGYLDGAVQSLYVIPAQGGEPRRLTDDAWNNTDPRWSPDSGEILYSAGFRPDAHDAYRGRLRIVTLDGQMRDLTGDWGLTGSSAWAPDGRVIFVGQMGDQPAGAKNNLWVVAREGGAPECRTAGLPWGVGGGLQGDQPAGYNRGPSFVASGDSAFACVQQGGTVQLYRVALSGDEAWRPVTAGERACYPLSAVGERLLYAASEFNNPADLFTCQLDGADERRLTYLNAELLDQCALPQAEHLFYPAPDGVEVEGWLLKPPVGQAPYPTILYNHGGPNGAFGHTFSFDWQMLAGAGYAVLLVNYRGSTGYGEAFSQQPIGAWGELDHADLMAGVDRAVALGLADPDRLGCCGLSFGGYETCWAVGHTDRFKAAVPENPLTNWYSMYLVGDMSAAMAAKMIGGATPFEDFERYRRCSPITYAHRCVTPTLLIQGESDYRCPAEQSEQFYTALKATGCVVEMLRLPGSPHGGAIGGPLPSRRAQNEALLDWMNRWVLEKKDTPSG